MSRLVREVRPPAGDDDGESAYATPDGEIVRVPQDFAFADTIVALEEEIPTVPLSQRPPPLSQRPTPERSERPRAMTGPPPQPQHERVARHTGPPPPGGWLHEPPTLPVPVHPAMPQMSQMSQMSQPMMMLDENGAYVDPNVVEGHPQMYMPGPAPFDPDAGIVTRSRSAFTRAGHEMKELWGATYDEQRDAQLAREEDPFVRLAGKLRRLRNMWGFFEWSQEDKMKAMWIGVAVFAFAIAFAVLLSRGSAAPAP